jgi:chromosome segregation ATPase
MIEYKNYKSYIIIGVMCFALGYFIAGWQGGASLHRLRVRTERYETLYRTYQARESAVTKRLEELQDQLGASRRAAAELGESIERSTKQIDAATRRTERVGNAIEGLAGIVRKVEERGPKKD